MHRGAVEKQAWSAGPPRERDQAGRHLERTRDSSGKALNEMVSVPEGGEGKGSWDATDTRRQEISLSRTRVE